MGLINLGAGLSAAGASVAQTAGELSLNEQKAALERQSIELTNALAAGREHTARVETGAVAEGQSKQLGLKVQEAQMDSFLRAAGYSGGLADIGYKPATVPPAEGPAPVPAPATEAAPAPLKTVANSPVEGLPKGVPVVVSGKGGRPIGIPLPPGVTSLQALLAGPDGLAKLSAEWAKPQNLRPGSALTYYDFNDGTTKTLVQRPNLPPGSMQAEDGSIVQIAGAADAIKAAEGAKAEGGLPVDLAKITATGEQARTTAGFEAGVKVATELQPTYDAATGATTLHTRADVLKDISGGAAPASAPPTAAPQSDTGLQRDGSFKMNDGSSIPPPPKLPQEAGGVQAEPSAADKATQASYAETIKGWNDSVLPAIQAEQRFQAMGEALKTFQSGAWATSKTEIGRQLIASGLPESFVTHLMGVDPAQAQIILKNNFSASLSTLAASRIGRITQNEIFALQKNLANPDLQPEANLAILSEGIGLARWQQSLAAGWNTARRMGYADPLQYQAEWTKTNPVQKFVDQAKSDIGQLKGTPPAVARISGDEEFNRLKSGTQFIGPDGVTRTKP